MSLVEDEDFAGDLIMDVKGKGKEIVNSAQTPRSKRVLRSSQQSPLVDGDAVAISAGSPNRQYGKTSSMPLKGSPKSDAENGEDSERSHYQTPLSQSRSKPDSDSDDDDSVLENSKKEAEPEPDWLAEFVKKARKIHEQTERKGLAEKASESPLVKDEHGEGGTGQHGGNVLGRSQTPVAKIPDPNDPIVHVLVTSEIPGTKPMRAYRNYKDTLGMARKSFVWKNEILKPIEDSVFLTWKGNRIYDHTSCASLGLKVDSQGHIIGARNIDDSGITDRGLHVQAWTEELYVEHEHHKALERRRLLGLMEDDEGDAFGNTESSREDTNGDAEGNEGDKIRIILSAKDQEPLKMKVYPRTTVEDMIAAFSKQRQVQTGANVTLYWDGEAQSPETTVEDMDLEDMDKLEIHSR